MPTYETINDAMWAWLSTCPLIGDLFFNASSAESGDTIIIPSDSIVETYIDGSTLRRYNVAVTRFEPVSDDPNDTHNIDVVNALDRVGEWIERQNAEGFLPSLSHGDQAVGCEYLPNESGYMAGHEDGIAKYMLQFRIEYIRKLHY